jgi:hypothetical protein
MRVRGIRPYITAAAIAAVAVLTIYALTVGRAADFNFSHNAKDWADFGEYVGGSLGATYGLLAFIGVMLTIKGAEETAIRQLTWLPLSHPIWTHFHTRAAPKCARSVDSRADGGKKSRSNTRQTDLVSL